MIIKNIYPKDISVIIEFRASDLEKIRMAMDDCKLTYFGPDQARMDAQVFFKEKFYPFLEELVKSLKEEA
jgi:hypothetical protein